MQFSHESLQSFDYDHKLKGQSWLYGLIPHISDTREKVKFAVSASAQH